VTIAHNSDLLRDQMVLDWLELHTARRDAVMGAVHNSDVADLNERAHALLKASGELGPVVASVDEREYCVGDRVLGLQNRYDLGILNGDVGRIVGAEATTIAVQLDAGRCVQLPLEYVADHLERAYARTVYKTQGLTCEIALLLGDDGLYAELGYTAITRGSHENRVYTVVSNEDFADRAFHLEHVVTALDRSLAKTAAIDYLEPPELP
jgi:ATP-dependent exoDNAse (exonuclease V) alpha subunit